MTIEDQAPGQVGLIEEIDAQLYARAEARAKAKGVHVSAPGSLLLPATPWRHPEPGDNSCGASSRSWSGDPAAQLRTAYVRISQGGQRATHANRYQSKAGKPAWIAIGIVCHKCGAFWRRPDVDLVALSGGSIDT